MDDQCTCGHHAEEHQAHNGWTGPCLMADCDCIMFEADDVPPDED